VATAPPHGVLNAATFSARGFLDLLYGEDAPGDVVLWTAPERRSHWHAAGNLVLPAQHAMHLAPRTNLYHSVALQDRTAALAEARARENRKAKRENRAPRQRSLASVRGYNSTALAIPGVWADIDVLDPLAHAATNLPPTLEAAVALAYELPVPPTLLIDSGHGLYAWWLFPELWSFENGQERDEAQRFVRRFHATLKAKADAHGWQLDPTSDLSRVLRLVGTTNHKQEPRPVQAVEVHPARRYNASDLEQYLIDVSPRTWRAVDSGDEDDFEPVPLAPIVAGCAWLRHTRDDATTSPEPEWYAMLGITGRCIDGATIAHEWSRPHPGYSEDETAAKLAHALDAAGPRTCKNIRDELNGTDYCTACPSWARSHHRLTLPTCGSTRPLIH
jgi:hypothetical protein